MILVWRGWGPLALAALILPAASCAGLMEYSPILSIAAFGVTLLAGGVACVWCGHRWNDGAWDHTLYWLPLQVWGWLYVVIGGLFVALVVAGVVWRLATGQGLA